METLEYSENRIILRFTQNDVTLYNVITFQGRYDDHYLNMETKTEEEFVMWLMTKEPSSPMLNDFEVIVRRK